MGGNLSVATAAVADVTSREKRSSGMAIVGIAFGLGFLVGPAIGGLCAKLNLLEWMPQLAALGINPFSTPALLSLLLALLNLVWVLRQFDETLPPAKRTSSADKPKLPVFQLLQSSTAATRRTNLVYLIYMLAFSGMEFTLTFLAVERFAFSPAQNGGMFVYIGFILIVVQGGIVRRLAPRLGEKRLAITGLACGTGAFCLLAVALQLAPFFAALAAMAISIGLVSPTLSALVSLYSDEAEQGKALGVFRSAGSLARAMGSAARSTGVFRLGLAVRLPVPGSDCAAAPDRGAALAQANSPSGDLGQASAACACRAASRIKPAVTTVRHSLGALQLCARSFGLKATIDTDG